MTDATMTPAITSDATISTLELMLRADRRGYVLGGDSIDGFEDRRDVGLEGRIKLARWARRFASDQLSDVQQELLDKHEGDRSSASHELLRAALQDAEEDVAATYALGFYDQLNEEELALVRDPSRHPKLRGRSYPLSMNDMETLTGATGRQLRHWNTLGLLPAHRVNNRRVFFGAAVARAFALKETKQHEVAALAELARGGPEAARFARMLGATLGSFARRLQGAASDELSRAAELVVKNSEALIHEAREVGASVPKESMRRRAGPRPRARASASGNTSSRASRSDGNGSGRVKRHVVHRPESHQWAVSAAPTGRASSTHSRKSDAIRAARTVVANKGGGQVVIHDRAGQPRDVTAVESSRRSKGATSTSSSNRGSGSAKRASAAKRGKTGSRRGASARG